MLCGCRFWLKFGQHLRGFDRDAEDGLVKLFDGKGFKVATRRKLADVTEEE